MDTNKRNERIYEDRIQGHTLLVIAHRYHLTGGRISQIVKSVQHQKDKERRALNRAKALRKAGRQQPRA